RVLPYRVQDRYSRERKKITLKTIVLENNFLKARFLCEYGGRLYSLFDKKNNRDLLYSNPIFQLANLANRNAWFSGGIEWNLGQFGHAFSTCEEMFFAKLTDANGNDFLRMYSYERCKSLFWHIDFYLDDVVPLLFSHVTVHNLNDDAQMYYWTNIAVAETKKTRVFSSSKKCIYIDPFVPKGQKKFGYGDLPYLATFSDLDASYPINSPYSNEYFFLCDDGKMSWELSTEPDGTAFFDVATSMLKYHKMFCWGNLTGGRTWQDFLSINGTAYVELQGGLAPTQMHGITMPKETAWSWTQAFGGLYNLDMDRTHATDYHKAHEYIEQKVIKEIDASVLDSYHQKFTQNEKIETTEKDILFFGTGWGALEIKRRKHTGEKLPPPSFNFSEKSLGEKQKPYQSLLLKGSFPSKNIHENPWEFEVSDFWLSLLEKNIQQSQDSGVLWNIYQHLGVIYAEKSDFELAKKAWKKSLEIQESEWVYRHLARVAFMEQHLDDAEINYEKALALCDEKSIVFIVEEYYDVLSRLKKYERLVNHCNSLLKTQILTDKMAIPYGLSLAKLGLIDQAQVILDRNFADIREGETPLTDIWFEIMAQKKAKELKSLVTEEIRATVQKNDTPPTHLDFRMK
ncbi:MAG: DUF5107 domain-containing protein, partial [Treponemataceae bacterium]